MVDNGDAKRRLQLSRDSSATDMSVRTDASSMSLSARGLSSSSSSSTSSSAASTPRQPMPVPFFNESELANPSIESINEAVTFFNDTLLPVLRAQVQQQAAEIADRLSSGIGRLRIDVLYDQFDYRRHLLQRGEWLAELKTALASRFETRWATMSEMIEDHYEAECIERDEAYTIEIDGLADEVSRLKIAVLLHASAVERAMETLNKVREHEVRQIVMHCSVVDSYNRQDALVGAKEQEMVNLAAQYRERNRECEASHKEKLAAERRRMRRAKNYFVALITHMQEHVDEVTKAAISLQSKTR